MSNKQATKTWKALCDETMIDTVLTVVGLPTSYFYDLVHVLSNQAYNSGVVVKFQTIGDFNHEHRIGDVNDIQITFRTQADRELNLKAHMTNMVKNYNEFLFRDGHEPGKNWYDKIELRV